MFEHDGEVNLRLIFISARLIDQDKRQRESVSRLNRVVINSVS